MLKLISIIIPVYNEEGNIAPIYDALRTQFSVLGADFDYEIIFINDGSCDNSASQIDILIQKDFRVKMIEFSRNFGKEIATTAGLHHAVGDAAIMIDADLQHPPELIPKLVAKWQQGFDMVIGVRQNNETESLIKRFGSIVFYKAMKLIGETKIASRTTDFRIIDRKVIDAFKGFGEHNRITRGLLDWLGFKKDYIYFTARPRQSGQASYSKMKLIKLALSTFVSHSLFPLKFAGYLGILIIGFSGPLGLFIFIDKYILTDATGLNFSGPAILAVINMFFTGVILSCLGLIALYIADIQGEVTNRPIYIVRSKKNFDHNQ
ncbi:MAG: glycosyltransferase family 2 protein [Patescibacteria group bacterium]|jgi:dolichol-phosphate mannosyltransferase|nr:glycosyltransferase family 2 protein [Patescibacteria group bacterium]